MNNTMENDIRTINSIVARENIGNLLCCIRKELVIPYIRSSEDAKAWGWSINMWGVLETKYPTITDGRVFPGAKELVKHFDATRIAILEQYSDQDEAIRKEKELEDALGHDIVFYANWRCDCSRYLSKLAKSADETEDMLVNDETPMKFISAIVSLCSVHFGYLPKDISSQVAEILASWRYLHDN